MNKQRVRYGIQYQNGAFMSVPSQSSCIAKTAGALREWPYGRCISLLLALAAPASGDAQQLEKVDPGEVSRVLDLLASASINFLIAMLAFAVFTAVLLEATRDFGLRRIVANLVLLRWAPEWSDGLRKYGATRSMLSLEPDELAGQVASLIKPALFQEDSEKLRDWLRQLVPDPKPDSEGSGPAFASDEAPNTRPGSQLVLTDTDSSEQERDEQDRLVAKADRAIDQLQLRLRSALRLSTLILSVLVALVLAFLLLIGVNVGALTTPIVLAITLSAAFAAPLLRELFKTITRAM